MISVSIFETYKYLVIRSSVNVKEFKFPGDVLEFINCSRRHLPTKYKDRYSLIDVCCRRDSNVH